MWTQDCVEWRVRSAGAAMRVREDCLSLELGAWRPSNGRRAALVDGWMGKLFYFGVWVLGLCFFLLVIYAGQPGLAVVVGVDWEDCYPEGRCKPFRAL